MARKNVYVHSVELKKIRIPNASGEKFAEAIQALPYRGYDVEDIANGRKIVIAKPGGKQAFGRMKKDDFFVFIHDPADGTFWQISHKQIYEDIEQKAIADKDGAIVLLRALERVYGGDEPDLVLQDMAFNIPAGETPEALLKAYKWIWGQEDVNYPTGKGRAMSWEGWVKQDNKMIKTGKGLLDLLKRLEET